MRSCYFAEVAVGADDDMNEEEWFSSYAKPEMTRFQHGTDISKSAGVSKKVSTNLTLTQLLFLFLLCQM